MSRYAVVYVEAATGRIESVVGRAMWLSMADRLAALMQHQAREGFLFKAVNEAELIP